MTLDWSANLGRGRKYFTPLGDRLPPLCPHGWAYILGCARKAETAGRLNGVWRKRRQCKSLTSIVTRSDFIMVIFCHLIHSHRYQLIQYRPDLKQKQPRLRRCFLHYFLLRGSAPAPRSPPFLFVSCFIRNSLPLLSSPRCPRFKVKPLPRPCAAAARHSTAQIPPSLKGGSCRKYICGTRWQYVGLSHSRMQIGSAGSPLVSSSFISCGSVAILTAILINFYSMGPSEDNLMLA